MSNHPHKQYVSMHRPGKAYWKNRYKKKYRNKFTASLFWAYYELRYFKQPIKHIYPCYWDDDFRKGTTAKKHYHIGTNKRLTSSLTHVVIEATEEAQRA